MCFDATSDVIDAGVNSYGFKKEDAMVTSMVAVAAAAVDAASNKDWATVKEKAADGETDAGVGSALWAAAACFDAVTTPAAA